MLIHCYISVVVKTHLQSDSASVFTPCLVICNLVHLCFFLSLVISCLLCYNTYCLYPSSVRYNFRA